MTSSAAQSGHWLEARWNRRNNDWIANLNLNEVSPRFRNDNGFLGQAGIQRVEGELIRRWGELALPVGFTAHEFETYSWQQYVGTLADAQNGIAGGQTVSRRWHPGLWFAGPRNSDGYVQLEIDAERTRPGGRLLAASRVAAELGINPAPWFTRATLKLSTGQRVDVRADRVGRGSVWLLDAKLRGVIAGFGVESEQQLQQSVIEHGGRRALTDSSAQWLGVVHFSARDSLRALWQASRFRREADAAAALAAKRFDGRTVSLVFQHRVGIGRNIAVGASTQRSESGGERRDELFVKAAIAL